MAPTHFHGHNIEVTVYKGLCEVNSEHHHPAFMFLFFNPSHSGEFWVLIEVIADTNDHGHECTASLEDINNFILNGELTLLTSKNEHIDHQHKLYFDINNKQGLTVDPVINIGKILGISPGFFEEIEDDDYDDYDDYDEI